MKPVFICDTISVATEMTEGMGKLQPSNSKLQGNFKLHTPIPHNSVPGIWGFSGRLLLDVAVFGCLPVAAVLFRGTLPAWGFMWAIAFALYLGCKWITWRRVAAAVTWPMSFCYFFLWPGMDPKPFISPALLRAASAGGWIRAARNTAAGGALVVSAVYLSTGNQHLWVGWVGMVGIVLFLHFGVFELLAAAWNKAGVRVKPVMQAPIRATSVAEFWGRRWNTAFNDLAHAFTFRPLVQALTNFSSLPKGNRTTAIAYATLLVFAISGLVHEMVISLPARGGYGLPTAYFVLQGLGVLLERSKAGRRIGLGHGLRGWLFTLACTAGPAFSLFHPTFARNVILPMLHAFGGK